MLPCLTFPAGGNTDPVNLVADLEDLEEEQMLMKAIAMSLEEEEELCSVKGERLLKKSTGQKEGGYQIKQ